MRSFRKAAVGAAVCAAVLTCSAAGLAAAEPLASDGPAVSATATGSTSGASLAAGVSAAPADPSSVGTSGAGTSPAGTDLAGTSASASPSGTSGSTPNATQAPVTVTIRSMEPRSPIADLPESNQKVTFKLLVSNNTDTTYSHLSVNLERAASIARLDLLEQAIAHPPDASATELVTPSQTVNKPLLPHGALEVTYQTTEDDMCLCFNGVYPYSVVVKASSVANPNLTEVGREMVLVPSFITRPAPVNVAWLWPLLARPHRLMSDTTFTDNGLATEVAPGGRLFRALDVAKRLAGRVRLTLVIDPDLIDSLSVMASGYKVSASLAPGAPVETGTGGSVAAAWLETLREVAPHHDVVLTPPADPDVDAIVRNGLTWTSNLDSEVMTRLSRYLPMSTPTIFWPANSEVTSEGLDSIVSKGFTTVVLDQAALPEPQPTDDNPVPPDSVAQLPTPAGHATAVVTNDLLQSAAQRSMSLGAIPAQDQQELLARLAVRAAANPEASQLYVITPDRYADVSPVDAAYTIATLASTRWSRVVGLQQGLASAKSFDRGPLQVSPDIESTEIPQASMQRLNDTLVGTASLRSALTNEDASALLSGFTQGVQRAQSSAWRADPPAGLAFVDAINKAAVRLTGAVHLVEPATRNYSLSSTDAPIVVTVANDLPREVSVFVRLQALRTTAGFEATDVGVQKVPANSRKTVSIPTRVNRIDKFKVLAELTAPDGTRLGDPIELNVRSTALGGITKVMTGLAGTVLVLALLFRVVRRLRRGYEKELPRTVGAAR